VIHAIAVPLFLVATVLALYALVSPSFVALVASLLGFMASLIMQRQGHRLERVQPEPFHGRVDFMCRILVEQWVTFPRFVATGGWWRAITRPTPEGQNDSSTVTPAR
jgi:hypothetical protein